jgi:hypothetical protein
VRRYCCMHGTFFQLTVADFGRVRERQANDPYQKDIEAQIEMKKRLANATSADERDAILNQYQQAAEGPRRDNPALQQFLEENGKRMVDNSRGGVARRDQEALSRGFQPDGGIHPSGHLPTQNQYGDKSAYVSNPMESERDRRLRLRREERKAKAVIVSSTAGNAMGPSGSAYQPPEDPTDHGHFRQEASSIPPEQEGGNFSRQPPMQAQQSQFQSQPPPPSAQFDSRPSGAQSDDNRRDAVYERKRQQFLQQQQKQQQQQAARNGGPGRMASGEEERSGALFPPLGQHSRAVNAAPTTAGASNPAYEKKRQYALELEAQMEEHNRQQGHGRGQAGNVGGNSSQGGGVIEPSHVAAPWGADVPPVLEYGAAAVGSGGGGQSKERSTSRDKQAEYAMELQAQIRRKEEDKERAKWKSRQAAAPVPQSRDVRGGQYPGGASSNYGGNNGNDAAAMKRRMAAEYAHDLEMQMRQKQQQQQQQQSWQHQPARNAPRQWDDPPRGSSHERGGGRHPSPEQQAALEKKAAYARELQDQIDRKEQEKKMQKQRDIRKEQMLLAEQVEHFPFGANPQPLSGRRPSPQAYGRASPPRIQQQPPSREAYPPRDYAHAHEQEQERGSHPAPPQPPQPLPSFVSRGAVTATAPNAQAYAQELKAQMDEKKRRSDEEKRRLQREDAKKDEEIAAYNPWGRPGAGAPVKSDEGKVQANMRVILHDEDRQTRYPSPSHASPPPNARQSSPLRSPAAGHQLGHGLRDIAGGGGGGGDPELVRKQHEMLDIQAALEAQIAEKKRRKEEEKRREKEEEAREEARIQKEQDELRQRYEAEEQRLRGLREEKNAAPVAAVHPVAQAVEVMQEQVAARKSKSPVLAQRLKTPPPQESNPRPLQRQFSPREERDGWEQLREARRSGSRLDNEKEKEKEKVSRQIREEVTRLRSEFSEQQRELMEQLRQQSEIMSQLKENADSTLAERQRAEREINELRELLAAREKVEEAKQLEEKLQVDKFGVASDFNALKYRLKEESRKKFLREHPEAAQANLTNLGKQQVHLLAMQEDEIRHLRQSTKVAHPRSDDEEEQALEQELEHTGSLHYYGGANHAHRDHSPPEKDGDGPAAPIYSQSPATKARPAGRPPQAPSSAHKAREDGNVHGNGNGRLSHPMGPVGQSLAADSVLIYPDGRESVVDDLATDTMSLSTGLEEEKGEEGSSDEESMQAYPVASKFLSSSSFNPMLTNTMDEVSIEEMLELNEERLKKLEELERKADNMTQEEMENTLEAFLNKDKGRMSPQKVESPTHLPDRAPSQRKRMEPRVRAGYQLADSDELSLDNMNEAVQHSADLNESAELGGASDFLHTSRVNFD